MAGRPSKKTPELMSAICERLGLGESLYTICDEIKIGYSTVMTWLGNDEAFQEQYARAREAQADFYAQECIQIADDGSNDTYELEDGIKKVSHDHIQRSRLRVDARKWYASKLAPKKYGEKFTQELTGADGKDLTVNLTLNIKPVKNAG